MSDAENLSLSEELLQLMRRAAQAALELREPFVTPKALLLAMLDDPVLGPNLRRVVQREKVVNADVESNFGAVRALAEVIPGEMPAMVRYDTLCFKTPDGRTGVWLSKEAMQIFMEGAKRVQSRYYPRELALGLAAEARLAPGILAAIRVEPGAFTDVI